MDSPTTASKSLEATLVTLIAGTRGMSVMVGSSSPAPSFGSVLSDVSSTVLLSGSEPLASAVFVTMPALMSS